MARVRQSAKSKEDTIRWMIRRDMSEVVRIDQSCYREHWDEATWVTHLRNRNCIAVVLERREGDGPSMLVGFLCYELRRGVIHVLRLGVDPEHRRSQVGTQLLKHVQKKLSLDRRKRIEVDVPQTMLEAHLFLKSVGWKCTGVFDTDDTYRFEHRIGESRSEWWRTFPKRR